jgi:hypothetical protein
MQFKEVICGQGLGRGSVSFYPVYGIPGMQYLQQVLRRHNPHSEGRLIGSGSRMGR